MEWKPEDPAHYFLPCRGNRGGVSHPQPSHAIPSRLLDTVCLSYRWQPDNNSSAFADFEEQQAEPGAEYGCVLWLNPPGFYLFLHA